MQIWVQPFGPAPHNIVSFSCGPMEKIIAHPWSKGLGCLTSSQMVCGLNTNVRKTPTHYLHAPKNQVALDKSASLTGLKFYFSKWRAHIGGILKLF